MAKEELLEERADGALADTDEDVIDGRLNVVPRAVGVVERGDASGSEIAEDVRVVRLPLAVVALADDNGGYGVERAMKDAAPSIVEIARVLMKQRRVDRRTKERSGELVSVGRCVALRVA